MISISISSPFIAWVGALWLGITVFADLRV